MKVAKKFVDAGKKIFFGVSNANDMRHELEEHGLSFSDKPVVALRDDKNQKFVMDTEFRYV